MWGYPTKGRGNNIDDLLNEENFKKLIIFLVKYSNSNISNEILKIEIKKIESIGISTISKFLYFLNCSIENNKCLILDLRIINCIRKNKFIELDELKTITYSNAIAKYELYLEIINKVANEINAASDQVEMFLFIFGNNLSELKGEEYYGDIDDI